jgi:hypothetical protein
MAINIGRGQLTLTDLNDAIISGTEPTSKVVGTLWVDESKSPKLVKRWDGSVWQVIGEIMDEGTGETITDITETLGNMANDNIIDFNERQVIKDKLTEILGYVIADDATTLPTTATLDSSNKGGFFTVRKSALNAGILSSESVYSTVATKYNDLKSYLEGLPTVDAWDLRATNKDKVISVVKGTFRDKWLQYYIAVDALATATAQKLKQNVTDLDIGGRNFGSNGDFAIQLTDGLWKDAYVGQVSEIVDISSEKPPFMFAYHVKNTTNTNGGIFTGALFEGEVANELVGKEITIQFWLKYQNIVQGTNTWNDGRFGELVVEGVTSTGTKVYSYPNVLGELVGTNMTWTKYSNTFKITLPASAVSLTAIRFKHGIEGATGEFWTTGIKVELGNKMTDWSANPLDMQGQIKDVLFKVTPENIMLSVKSTQTYVDLENKVDSKTKTFVNTPTIPYYIGDVWKNGSTVYICTVNRTSGSYTSGDWTKVGDVTGSNTAYDTARVGGTTASTVRDNASNAMTAINNMSSDDKLTPVEKQQLKKEWATISAEKATYEALATTYSIGSEKSNYVTAYNTLNTALNGTNGYLLNLTTTTDLGAGGGANFRLKFDDYYDKKALMIKKINETARELANEAKEVADSKVDAIYVKGELDSLGDLVNYASFDKNDASATPFRSTAPIRDTAQFHSYVSSFRFPINSTGVALKRDIPVMEGEILFWEFWMKTDSDWNGTAGNSKFRIGNQSGALMYAQSYNGVKTSWTKMTGTWTVTSGTTKLQLSFGNDGTTGNIWIDDIIIAKKAQGKFIVDSDKWNEASTDATNAKNAIADMSSDSKVTPVEKVQLKKEWATISAEKATYEALATTYGISSTGDTERTRYTNSYNTLNTTLNGSGGILTNMTTTSTVDAGTFRSQFDDYYDKKALLIKKINETSRELANNAQSTANSKSKTFTSTPTTPYTIGDVWKNGSTVYICTVTRASGSYVSGDWTKVGDVTGSNTSADTSAVNGIPASTVKGVLVNGTDVINANPIFLDWTSTNPSGYSTTTVNGLSKVVSSNGMGNAVKYTVVAGGSHYLSPSQVTNQPYFQYITVESTFMLESGTIDGAGILMRYNGTANTDHKIHFKDLVSSPTPNKWYTVSKTIKQPTSPSGFTGYSVFPMGGWASFGTVTAKVIQFDSVIARPATEQEINSYENDIMIRDMSTDGKITPMEKVQLKKEWATISAEKATYDTLANTYLIPSTGDNERAKYNTAYNTLNTTLNGSGGVLVNMSTTSTVTATDFRNKFDDYYDKKAVLTRKINEIARQLAVDAQDDIDNLEIGGTNLVDNSNFKRDLSGWGVWGTATRSVITNGNKKFAKLADAGTGTYRGISRIIESIESSTQYTISFVAYAVSGSGNVGIHQKNGSAIVTQNWWASVTLTTTPKKYSFTFTTTSSTVDNFLLMIGGENGKAFEVYYTDIQIEKGNRATDWSPSTKDVQWEVDNIQVGGRNLALKTATAQEMTGNAGTNQTSTLYSIAGGSLSRYAGRPVTLSFDWFIEGASPSGTIRVQGSNPYPAISETITFSSSNMSGRMVLTSDISDTNMTFSGLNFRMDNVPTTISFTVYNLKLEIGNRATDWTPAPEDIQGQLDEKADAETITEEFNSAIVETAQDITTTLEQKIYDESGKITKAYQSELEQTAKDLNLTFTEYDERIKNAEGEVLEIKTYFNFSSDGLNIGKSDSPLNINVSNDQIDFIDNGTIVAYINGQMMYIDSLQVLSSLIVGNHKIEKYNDSITLIKYSG